MKLKAFRILIVIVSTLAFFLQMKTSIDNLNDPKLADNTEIIPIEDIATPLITICPMHQLNESKILELGYKKSSHFLSGVQKANESGYILTWGFDTNQTFHDLVEYALNYDINANESTVHFGEFVNGVLTTDKYTPTLKKRFIVGSWGYCWDLEDYNISNIFSISLSSNAAFEVLISDKEMKTFYGVDYKMVRGQKLLTDPNYMQWYEIDVKKYSTANPKEPACEVYDDNKFENCVDCHVQDLIIPNTGCNPPWLSTKNVCKEKVFLDLQSVSSYHSKEININYENNNDKDYNIHKNEALVGLTNINTCRISELNKQNINV